MLVPYVNNGTMIGMGAGLKIWLKVRPIRTTLIEYPGRYFQGISCTTSMKLNQQHIDYVRREFARMQTKQDIATLLSYAANALYNKECDPILSDHLIFYANPKLCGNSYNTFGIRKKSGGKRLINAPVDELKFIHCSLNFVLQCIHTPHKAATGFVLNKSIVDNATQHVGNKYVYNIDLKDFFHSFDRNRVKLGFMYEPFNLNGKREPLAYFLACLCTISLEIDGETKSLLPQGSPTSPTISNILCEKLDHRLTGLAKRFGTHYSRYADDITFSSSQNIFKGKDFLKELHRIIEEDQHLKINQEKTRLQDSLYQQEVTGLVVNVKVNVKQRYVKRLRMWLHYWEKYGYDKAKEIFLKDYFIDKGHVKKGKPNFENVLNGKLEFLKMVKGINDGTYSKLKERFDYCRLRK
jgi:RNA-directed DNA polymerase